MTPLTSLPRPITSRDGKPAAAPSRDNKTTNRHHMLSQTIVLEAESRERFETLLTALMDEHQPVTETEIGLVESMAVARWRQLRVWSIEKADFDYEMAKVPRSLGPNPIRAAQTFRSLAQDGKALTVALRVEASFDRQFTRALRTFLMLKGALGPT